MAVITLFISTSYLGAISSLRGPRRDRFGLQCKADVSVIVGAVEEYISEYNITVMILHRGSRLRGVDL